MPEVPAGPAARALIARSQALQASLGQALVAPQVRRQTARQAFESVRDEIVRQQLSTIPIARLRETTQGRLRLGPIEAAGYRTVADARRASPSRLEQLPGVGPQTASHVVGAAYQLEATLKESVRVRFDPVGRPAAHEHLLSALRCYEATERVVTAHAEQFALLAKAIADTLGPAQRASSRWKMFFSGRQRREDTRQALAQLAAVMESSEAVQTLLGDTIAEIGRATSLPGDVWHEYEARAVAYNGLLIEVGELGPELDAVQGFVPSEIAARVNDHPLDTSLLTVSLRGYQAFGAKFALAQGRAMLGDEMGLGKTIEALAAMSHLRSEGDTHFLVVCPASVLVNWSHEIQRHSRLRPHRLHGADRTRNARTWQRAGGVGITTYSTLSALPKPDETTSIGLLVVDEAHYVKNPEAARTAAVRRWTSEARRTLFLTGTPMENRVDEFRVLVHHLQPRLAAQITAMDGLAGAAAFRKAVAPVYLRRNQADVLSELPPRIEAEEWVEFLGEDMEAYRQAVASGNFMAMRRAAYLSGSVSGSAKLARLTEIVEEAAANDRKVVVFSFFRDVLSRVAQALGERAIGPLTGSVAPAERQHLVDEFTARSEPTALVSQIEAGGVGLNMQAGSVVILTEPQWKPTVEDQAIARCHRMGQIRPVDVHRLLAEDSVDQRMLEVLATKKLLFNEYVRKSELKDISPQAVDVSDAEATREVVSQAEAERRIVEMEQKRLGIEPTMTT